MHAVRMWYRRLREDPIARTIQVAELWILLIILAVFIATCTAGLGDTRSIIAP